jgi:hypothetical protein
VFVVASGQPTVLALLLAVLRLSPRRPQLLLLQ